VQLLEQRQGLVLSKGPSFASRSGADTILKVYSAWMRTSTSLPIPEPERAACPELNDVRSLSLARFSLVRLLLPAVFQCVR